MPPQRKAPPPRKPTGRKRPDPGGPARRSWLAVIVGAGLVGLALVVVGVAYVATRGGEARSPEEALASAGCTFETLPSQGQQHVASYDAKVDYNSFPPTSGTHHQVPVIWGSYTDEVPTVAEVHNLEHGGVIIHYGDGVSEETRERLQAFYSDSPNAMLLAPLAGLGDRVSLTAWTRLATCKTFDESAFAAFRSAYRGNGPERFRIGDLMPGT